MTENQSFTNRLSLFIDNKNLSIREFERETGVGNAVISSAIRNKGYIGTDKLIKIFTKFPELNIKWLLIGEGEMIENKYDTNEKESEIEENRILYDDKDKFIEHLQNEIEFLRDLLKSKI